MTAMEQEFITCLDRHSALLHKVCHTYAYDPEQRRDLFQEIVVQLWRAFPKYNPALKWTTWAYRIALNVAITQRRKTTLPTVSLTDPFRQAAENSLRDHPYDAAADEQTTALYRAIAQLNAAEKALVLLFLDDIPYAEIAEITGITENYVGVKMSRVKAKLKTLVIYGKY